MVDGSDEGLGPETSECSGEAAEQLLTTGDMARLTDSTLRTIRFYEEAGLIAPVARDDGKHRLFPGNELQKLRLILDLREAGLSVHDIKELFALKSHCVSAESASQKMSAILEHQVEEMQRKIAILRRLREELASTVAVIRECEACDNPKFPLDCKTCEVVNRPDIPRAVKLLWNR